MRGEPWSALERAAFDTCEPDVAGWLIHPGETVSALGYFVAAAVIWRASRPLAAGSPARCLPVILFLVGTAALLFHASFATVFQRLDLATIPLLTGLLLASALVHTDHVARDRRRACWAALAGFGAVAPFVHTALGYVVVTLQAASLLGLWWSNRSPAVNDMRYRPAGPTREIEQSTPAVARGVCTGRRRAGVACSKTSATRARHRLRGRRGPGGLRLHPANVLRGDRRCAAQPSRAPGV